MDTVATKAAVGNKFRRVYFATRGHWASNNVDPAPFPHDQATNCLTGEGQVCWLAVSRAIGQLQLFGKQPMQSAVADMLADNGIPKRRSEHSYSPVLGERNCLAYIRTSDHARRLQFHSVERRCQQKAARHKTRRHVTSTPMSPHRDIISYFN